MCTDIIFCLCMPFIFLPLSISYNLNINVNLLVCEIQQFVEVFAIVDYNIFDFDLHRKTDRDDCFPHCTMIVKIYIRNFYGD